MIEPTVEHLALGVAFLSAGFFGMEGIVGKRGIEAGGNAKLTSLVVAAVSVVVFGAVAVVDGGVPAFRPGAGPGYAAFFFAGVLASGIGVLAIWNGVDRVGASINTAVVNSRPLFATLLGFLLLGEALRPVTAGGIVVLVVGLVLIGLSRGGDITGWAFRSLLFPLSAAVVFAMGNVLRRFALSRTAVPLFEGIAINAVGGLVVLVAYVILGEGRRVLAAPRRAYAWFVLTGLTTAAGLLALFYALQREQVAIIDAIVATAPLFTLIATRAFLRDVERVTTRLLVGALFVVLGAVFIVGF